MAVTSGFFDSVAGDRTYNAAEFSSFFDGIIHDGVLNGWLNELEVTATAGLTVAVASGRAWFNSTWTLNDSILNLAAPSAHPTLPRIDSVVVEINKAVGTRANTIRIIQGTAASAPVPPVLSTSPPVYQYELARIQRPAGSTSISAGNVTDRRGTETCPYASLAASTTRMDLSPYISPANGWTIASNSSSYKGGIVEINMDIAPPSEITASSSGNFPDTLIANVTFDAAKPLSDTVIHGGNSTLSAAMFKLEPTGALLLLRGATPSYSSAAAIRMCGTYITG